MAAQQSLKEFLIDKTATELSQSAHLTADVLRWVFKDVTKAVKIHEEIEISGFGKFLISQNKLRKRIARLEQIKERMEALPKTEDMVEKLSGVAEDLQYYYSKLKTNETKQENISPDMGRLPEFAVSTGEDEGGNREGGK